MSWNHLRVVDLPEVQEVDASIAVTVGNFGNYSCQISLLLIAWLMTDAVLVWFCHYS